MNKANLISPSLGDITALAAEADNYNVDLLGGYFECQEATAAISSLLSEGERAAAELKEIHDRLAQRHLSLTYGYEPPGDEPLPSELTTRTISPQRSTASVTPERPAAHLSDDYSIELEMPSVRTYAQSQALLKEAVARCDAMLTEGIGSTRVILSDYRVQSLEQHYLDLDEVLKGTNHCLALLDQSSEMYQTNIIETRQSWSEIQRLWVDDERLLKQQLREKGIPIPPLV